MVTTLNDSKRQAIAEKLADMQATQRLLIANDEKLLVDCPHQEVRKRLQDMLADDRKNLGILETVQVQYGVQAEPSRVTQRFVEQVGQTMTGSELSFYQKLAQHELLKHGQVMSGLLVHKAGQQVGADVGVAIGPLNTLNFENRAHQEQLKGMLELVGVQELTGQEADQSLWARVQDAVAALSGVAGSVVTQTSNKDDVDIQTIIRLDHAKANTLFTEIGATKDPQKLQEYFGQLYKDLLTHAKAEEEVVYPRVRAFYGDANTQELYNEQAEMEVKLNAIKAMSPTAVDLFRSEVRQLMEAVGDHMRQEESTLFAAIDRNCTTEQKEQMATQFKTAKARIQQEMASRLS
jgi:hemerythrin superfamily protein